MFNEVRPMSKLTRLLHKPAEREQTERTRAIRGTGNCLLASTQQHCAVDIDHRANITEKQREKRTARFFKDNQTLTS